MSTLVYGALTKKREEAQPDTSATTGSPGLATYIDALAALVPAEVLGLHAALLSFTTNTVKDTITGQATTTITEPGTLRGIFIALVILSIGLYVGSHFGQQWDRLDYVRMLIPPLAFAGWTMLQKSTAFDAIAPGMREAPRDAIAVIGAAVLGFVATKLAYAADQKVPNVPDPNAPNPNAPNPRPSPA